MSRDARRALVQERAFNATPRRDDLGAKHLVKRANNPDLHGKLYRSLRQRAV